ncbi:PLDc N-terminal domain-containing protein [Vagococcus zengguangii]|nr:PLDc N-terminal domain-containing protein [Vagococcus zengguangii]
MTNFLLFLPLIILQFGLMIIAVLSVLKKQHFKYLSKWIWLFIVILGQLVGPILFFVLERDE